MLVLIFFEIGGGIEGEMFIFKCLFWWGCDCSGGMMRFECSGFKDWIEDDGFIIIYLFVGGVK